MNTLVDIIDDILAGVLGLAGGVSDALGVNGALIMVLAGAAALIWIVGRALRV